MTRVVFFYHYHHTMFLTLKEPSLHNTLNNYVRLRCLRQLTALRGVSAELVSDGEKQSQKLHLSTIASKNVNKVSVSVN